ncbi:UTP--glucose-1-phosphate uridylyltransferase GalU [Cohnella zeiphila]|uniref:UTP--glucose-1-phosphate uridylyltransferase n=1 Tax=Cohnella zeiphila TaxID=2761120 RepID=A0A7X0VV44_9BACL|nr:UTP--glucose-1-phosphate uridylyltransferase GalU [Cohnella zeiphila]MBB6729533.1 UTP--glucose-1-phosphate uridylyltransferase GalU [Cohnella zeiphila]
MNKIRKAVIPAAGLGTRFLPATKALPKEMLPIVDKPAIQYIVEEAVASGIESILIITGRNKKAIEDHFDKSAELERTLEERGKAELLEQIRGVESLAAIHYIRQSEPLGLGHAIRCAEPFVGDEPFAVLLGDDIMVSEPPALRQLLRVYETYGRAVVGVRQVPREETGKYGIVAGKKVGARLREATALVEKPDPADAPSNVAILGRYVLPPSIFPILHGTGRGAGGEFQLTDALQRLCETEPVYALEMEGRRHDIGDKFGYIQAIVDMSLRREELRPRMEAYLAGLFSDRRKGSFA